MHCPHCNANLEGELIYQTFLKMYNDHEKARSTAALYGATETQGHWGREIGIQQADEDYVSEWECPDCGGKWMRNE